MPLESRPPKVRIANASSEELPCVKVPLKDWNGIASVCTLLPARFSGAEGLADDRLGQRAEAELSTRQGTLIQAEHLRVIAQLARVDQVDPAGLQRNLVVSGINLLALRNARLRVGGALLEVVGPCQPCSRMEETIGPGGYAAMPGHGGMTVRVIVGGPISVGDAVRAQA
jgi:MOSC domain-containing protein YiiM